MLKVSPNNTMFPYQVVQCVCQKEVCPCINSLNFMHLTTSTPCLEECVDACSISLGMLYWIWLKKLLTLGARHNNSVHSTCYPQGYYVNYS